MDGVKKFNTSPAAVLRRKRVITRLENQLLTGFKTVYNAETGEIGTEKLSIADKERIIKEIDTLKKRL